MARFLLRIFAPNRRKYRIWILAFIWCFGIVCGIWAASFAGSSFVSLMRMAAGRPVSIVNLLMVSVLPFLLSAVSVYLRSWHMLTALCFLKAFLFGFISAGAHMAYGSAGWLLWLMVMFSDICCLVPLWWYWISGIQCNDRYVARLMGCLAAVCIIISLDHAFVSPFLVGLIEL